MFVGQIITSASVFCCSFTYPLEFKSFTESEIFFFG